MKIYVRFLANLGTAEQPSPADMASETFPSLRAARASLKKLSASAKKILRSNRATSVEVEFWKKAPAFEGEHLDTPIVITA